MQWLRSLPVLMRLIPSIPIVWLVGALFTMADDHLGFWQAVQANTEQIIVYVVIIVVLRVIAFYRT